MKLIYSLCIIALFALMGCEKESLDANTGTVGKGGSLARFIVHKNYLYAVDNQYLTAYRLDPDGKMTMVEKNYIGFDIETIFANGDQLFMGSQSAMYIYDIKNPATPQKLGQASHLRSCDPVVVNKNIAYVTLHAGTTCGGNQNQLMVYDINELNNPKLIRTIEMTQPIGMGISDNLLYVCNGAEGLVTYDITSAADPQKIAMTPGEHMLDVIVLDNYLLIMLQNGWAIYEKGSGTLQQISKVVG